MSESERAEFVSKVTRLETQVASLSNDLRAAREIARSTGELADQSATYIAELKKKHRALETRMYVCAGDQGCTCRWSGETSARSCSAGSQGKGSRQGESGGEAYEGGA